MGEACAAPFPRHTLPYPWFRAYLHVSRNGGRAWFTQILARATKTRENLSCPLIADHRSARWGRGLSLAIGLFARRINICSSACFYVCPDNFVARNTGTGYVCPTSSPRYFRNIRGSSVYEAENNNNARGKFWDFEMYIWKQDIWRYVE